MQGFSACNINAVDKLCAGKPQRQRVQPFSNAPTIHRSAAPADPRRLAPPFRCVTGHYLSRSQPQEQHMRTGQQTRLTLPGTRERIYEIDLVDTAAADAPAPRTSGRLPPLARPRPARSGYPPDRAPPKLEPVPGSKPSASMTATTTAATGAVTAVPSVAARPTPSRSPSSPWLGCVASPAPPAPPTGDFWTSLLGAVLKSIPLIVLFALPVAGPLLGLLGLYHTWRVMPGHASAGEVSPAGGFRRARRPFRNPRPGPLGPGPYPTVMRSWITARRSSMPAPFSDEVASTSGNAAGCLARAAVVAASSVASSCSLILSALVSTT
jgi:hypothetical protein